MELIKAKSYKVYTSRTGELFMTVICNAGATAEQLTKLLNNGIKVTIVDERSAIVDKDYVE